METINPWPVEPARSILRNAYGREDAIHAGRCINSPIGCGRLIEPLPLYRGKRFRNRQSEAEYAITGTCQTCQDDFEDRMDRAEREEEEIPDSIYQIRSHETGPLVSS